MKPNTMIRVAEAIQLLQLDGYEDYSNVMIAETAGISRKTLERNSELVEILDFAVNPRRYHLCMIRS